MHKLVPKLDAPTRQRKLNGMPKTFIDLFAGIGGFHWALKDLGYECLLAVEKDESAKGIYSNNFKEIERHKRTLNRLVGDIRVITRHDPEDEYSELKPQELTQRLANDYKINEGDVGIICGGFPCQPFSKSGEQKGDRDKTRGTLFRDILLLTRSLRPDFLILENVRNLAGKNHVHTLATIVKEIRELDYEIEDLPITLSPHQLALEDGSPQVRDRVFIIARKAGLKQGAHPAEVTRHIKNIKELEKPTWDAGAILCGEERKADRLNKSERKWLRIWEKFLQITHGMKLPGHPIWTDDFETPPDKSIRMPKWKRGFLEANHRFYLEITKDRKRKAKLVKWLKELRQEKKDSDREDARIIPASRRKFEWQANRAFKEGEKRTLEKLLIQFRPSGIRVKPATHYPALVAITQTAIIGPRVGSRTSKDFRYITPKEAARLQGMYQIDFGDQADSLSFKQLGNAVNVNVIKYIATRLTGVVPCGTQ
jgi:DNA (cytosine-5)-methyltransferase 1